MSSLDQFLTDVRMRAATQVAVYVCNRDGRDPRDFDDAPDPADVHEDVREMLGPFFDEIRANYVKHRGGSKGDAA